MDDEVARLRGLGVMTASRLDGDHFLKHGIERSLQICIEVVVDVAQRILALEGRAPASSASDALKSLEAMGVIVSAERYRPMVQFRNFIVHRYESIDSAVLASVLNQHLGDLAAFRDEVTGKR